jgi:hypothetical protein
MVTPKHGITFPLFQPPPVPRRAAQVPFEIGAACDVDVDVGAKVGAALPADGERGRHGVGAAVSDAQRNRGRCPIAGIALYKWRC